MGLGFCKAYITTEKEEYEDMLKESGNLIIGIRPILSIIWIFDSYNTTSRWIFHKGVYPAAEILGPTSRPVCSLAVFLIMDENESFIEVEYIEGGGGGFRDNLNHSTSYFWMSMKILTCQ